jgi:hypothetical protein
VGTFLFLLFLAWCFLSASDDRVWHCCCRSRNSGCLIVLAFLLGFPLLAAALLAFG